MSAPPSDHTSPPAVDLNPPMGPLLIQGGSPAALLLLDRLDSPEARQKLYATMEALAEQIRREILLPFGEALNRAAAALSPALRALQDAGRGASVAGPAEDARARALRLRRERGTGPDRQIQHRPGPRRLQP